MSDHIIGLLLIVAGLLAHLFEGMVVKHYGSKHGKGGMFFNAVLCLFASVYFFVTDTGGFQLPTGVFWYGAFNSILYGIGFYTGYLALASGSFGLTRLCTSFSSLIPILYGIIWLGEPTTPFTIAGTVLVLIAVFLMMYQKRKDGETSAYSAKWIVSLVLMILSNAMISIVSKMQHNEFGDTYKNEYLIVSFVGAALWLTILGFIYERQNLRTVLRYGVVYGMAAGLFNGINNLLILVTYNYLPLSTISPIKTILSKLLSFAVALLIYREKFNRWQWAGVAVGIGAVLLMNL